MMNNKKKVLVCSIPCWNKRIGSDTFSSLMEGYDIDKIANLYVRDGVPDSEVCKNYFCISENAVIKSIFSRKLIAGKHIITDNIPKEQTNQDKSIVAQYKGTSHKRNYLLIFVREFLWMIGKWKTKELDKFLDDFAPDTVFFAMEGYTHFNRINRYILKRTHAKGVGYFWDDNFTYKQSKSLGYKIYRFFQRRDLKKTVKLCSDFFAISPKTKKEADEFFGIDCKILTKPVDFSNSEFAQYTPSLPIQMLYTGKLIIGRWDTIKIIGKALDIINKDSVKVKLDIYTTTVLGEKETNDLSPYVRLLGAIPQNEVAAVQQKADVLLFAEALSGDNSKIARLSFSTKITDYFRSGKCIFAVGDADIAPMEYLKSEDAAFTATSFEEVLAALERIVVEPSLINDYAQKAYECGKKNHDKVNVKKILFETLNG